MPKVDNSSNPKAIDNNYHYDTTKYMAYEVLRKKLESMKLYPFLADVVICNDMF